MLKKDPHDLRYVDSLLAGLSTLDEFEGRPRARRSTSTKLWR
jgi:hypothetical protein